MILHPDSFDNYATADLTAMYTQLYALGASGVSPAIGAYGRRGTQGVRFSSTGATDGTNPQVLSMVIDNATDTVTIGRAITIGGSYGNLRTFSTTGAYSSLSPVLSTSSGVAAGGACVSAYFLFRANGLTQIGICPNRDGTLYVARASGLDIFTVDIERITAVLGTTTQALLIGQSYYIEVQAKMHDTLGTVVIKVNGDTWLSLSGVDTLPPNTGTYTAEIAMGMLRGGGGTVTMDVDDSYVVNIDTSDTLNTPTSFLGDVAITYLSPVVDVLQGWTCLTGTDHFAMVDEIPPDGDTSYNYTTTLNAIDTFGTTAAPLVGVDIVAMSPIYMRRRVAGGNTSTCPVWRIGGVNYLREAQGDATTYTFWWGTWTVNPATLGVILPVDYNASSVGYKKVS